MKKLLLLLPLLVLSGCISLLPKAPPPPRFFALDAGDVAPMQQAPLDAVVAISPPQGERDIMGTDLVWRTGSEVAFIGGTRWSGRAQNLLQSALIETLSRQGGVRAVVRSGEVQPNYEVRWTVRSFEVVDQGAGGVAHFAANALIIETRTSRVIAVRDIATEAPVASRSASQAADGLTRAAREGSARLGIFVVEVLSAQARTASSSR